MCNHMSDSDTVVRVIDHILTNHRMNTSHPRGSYFIFFSHPENLDFSSFLFNSHKMISLSPAYAKLKPRLTPISWHITKTAV